MKISTAGPDGVAPPLVTAMVSTYGAERFMRGCLEDLVAQTLGDRLEILVIDAASPEGEGEIVREFQARGHTNIRYLRTPEREPTSEAFNRAIGMARGKYLTTANTDDRHRADALEVMARALEEHPEFGIVYADSLITNVANETFEANTARRQYAWPDFSMATGLSCCLFGAQPVWRRDVHDEVGVFDTGHLIANDQDMFLRIAWRFGAVHLREALGLFLQRPDSNSGADFRGEAVQDVVAVMQKYRRAMPLEAVFPGLADAADVARARAAAWVEMGSLSALGPYNDFGFALECYQNAMREADAGLQRELGPVFANNTGCVLAAVGMRDKADAAFALAGAVGLENRRLMESAGPGPGPARRYRFVALEDPVVRASRCTRGLELAADGALVWSAAEEHAPWDVYDGPNGVALEAGERVVTLPVAPRVVAPRMAVPQVETVGATEEVGVPLPGRVMLVMYGWNDTGGGTMLPRQVARAFAARGAEVSVFYAAAHRDPALGSYAVRRHTEDGVALFGLCNRDADFMDLAGPAREVDDPRVREAFAAVLEERSPDVVHFFNLHNLGMSLPSVARAAGVPTVLSSNNYWAICPRLYLVDEQLTRCDGAGRDGAHCVPCLGGAESGAAGAAAHAARTAAARVLLNEDLDAHLAVSERVRELYVQNGAEPERVEVLQQQPETLDLLWREVGARRAIVPTLDRPLRVGFIGSLMAHKGVHVLVAALQAFPRGTIECVLHGGVDLHYARDLQRLDGNDVVEFGGVYGPDDLPSRLAEVDVVVVPSVWDDCAPFVVAEALAARAPVIGAAIGGIPDFIKEGETGLLFPPDDAQALARTLARFFEDPTLLGQMQRAIAQPRGFATYLNDLATVYTRVQVGQPTQGSLSEFVTDS